MTESIFGPAERRAERPPGAFSPEAIWGPVKHAPGSSPSSEGLADIWGPPAARALPPPPGEVAAELWSPLAQPPTRDAADAFLWDEAPATTETAVAGDEPVAEPGVPRPRPSVLHRIPRSLEGAWAAGPSRGGWFERRVRARRD